MINNEKIHKAIRVDDIGYLLDKISTSNSDFSVISLGLYKELAKVLYNNLIGIRTRSLSPDPIIDYWVIVYAIFRLQHEIQWKQNGVRTEYELLL